ncbi:MAG: TrkH family potassium uptake protein [Spirochaetaceae bacterium]|jgi:trk system potassium uptake protein TrkH|nr:TrkH family potassium uptake protein [Spirochaetaceae bacterium]
MRLLLLLRLPLIVQSFLVPLLIAPLVIALYQGDADMVYALGVTLAVCILCALPLLVTIKKIPVRITRNGGFVIVGTSWFFLVINGALPYYFSDGNFSLCASIFESACAFSTTGGTVINLIEELPRSLLLWRALSYWAGGMGVVVLSVALMPLLGGGGFQLIKAETTGPEKDRLTPRIAATARALYLVYFSLTIILVTLYKLGGMELFDAVCHALSLMATGGVSTKNAGLLHYNSNYIIIVSTVFMLIAASNFNLYFFLIKGKIRDIIDNTEFRVYLAVFAAATIIIGLCIIPLYASPGKAFIFAAAQSAGILTTAGIAFADFHLWNPLAQTALFMLMFLGGCSGSTAGGIKIIRHVILWKQTLHESKCMLYPLGVFSIRLNKKAARSEIVYGTAGFVFLYILCMFLCCIYTTAFGVDLWTSINAALAVLGNLGLGFGGISPGNNFGIFPDHILWFYSFMMVVSRLELWTVFVLFVPAFWRGAVSAHGKMDK